ncbi:hypothetical protein SETIT_2G106300v2 [Setaria italica]|uniref:Uncharacterized protein n=1 Tax=Setaria italica TaxID=4555 RepID=A0A368PXM7_SETIT|nr:hypothetical protein SETIT_2G106300v2 [Setaria italica]
MTAMPSSTVLFLGSVYRIAPFPLAPLLLPGCKPGPSGRATVALIVSQPSLEASLWKLLLCVLSRPSMRLLLLLFQKREKTKREMLVWFEFLWVPWVVVLQCGLELSGVMVLWGSCQCSNPTGYNSFLG